MKKLFVWEGVLRDHNYGMMFAYAKNVKKARQAILDVTKSDYDRRIILEDIKIKPRIINKTEGFYVIGSA